MESKTKEPPKSRVDLPNALGRAVKTLGKYQAPRDAEAVLSGSNRNFNADSPSSRKKAKRRWSIVMILRGD